MTPAHTVSRLAGAAVACGVAALSTTDARAQDWPRRPLKLIVAQSPGSTTDILARLLAQRLAPGLGQQLLVDNRAGAGGLLGADLAAKAPADGYTLLIANPSTHGISSVTYKSLPYDPVKDFAPITRLADTDHVIVTAASQPYATMKEAIAAVQANPDKLNYGSAGHGSSHHLSLALLAVKAGNLQMLHVPYKGTGPMLTAAVTGDVLWAMPAKPGALGTIRGGKLRALAVTGPKRAAELPEVPALGEIVPGFSKVTWYGLLAPAATPPAIVARLNAAVTSALDTPEARQEMDKAGLEVRLSTPEALAAHIRTEIEEWGAAAKAADFKPE